MRALLAFALVAGCTHRAPPPACPEPVVAVVDDDLPPTPDDAAAIGALLDDWHQAASVGDAPRYFAYFAPDAVFIGGGVTMFGTFFTLPLKQIKRAVTDVGLANVAFISYVHQVLQISHTFSYFYLNGDISFDEIKGAAKQIEDISHGAILTLNMAGSDGDQAQFDAALLNRIKAEAKPATANPTPPADTETI